MPKNAFIEIERLPRRLAVFKEVFFSFKAVLFSFKAVLFSFKEVLFSFKAVLFSFSCFMLFVFNLKRFLCFVFWWLNKRKFFLVPVYHLLPFFLYIIFLYIIFLYFMIYRVFESSSKILKSITIFVYMKNKHLHGDISQTLPF